MARPSKLTAELQEKICNALRAGSTRRAAALTSGITETLFFFWMKRGREAARNIPDGEESPEEFVPAEELRFLEFFESVTRAEAECETFMSATIRKAAQGYDVTRTKSVVMPDGTTRTETVTTREFHPDAAMWWLERRRPDEYKPKTATDITSGGESLGVIGYHVIPPTPTAATAPHASPPPANEGG